MLEELIVKLAISGKRIIGGFLGLTYGIVWCTMGFSSMLLIMGTTLVGVLLCDERKIKKLKKLVIERLKDE